MLGMMMLSNPFSTLERQNFPEFSPIFARTTTPASGTVRLHTITLREIVCAMMCFFSSPFREMVASDGPLTTLQDL